MPQCTLCPWKVLGWFKPGLVPPLKAIIPEAEALAPSFESVHGMKALCALVNRSEATILDWISNRDFPAVKVDDEWTADRTQVVDWLKKEVWKCD